MSVSILDKARAHLIHSLRGKHNSFETKHPWRRGWEFAVLHSLRVEAYVLKILARERHPLSDHEIVLLRLAAILHDIWRLDQREGHAQRGAEIAREWLQGHPGPLERADIDRVVAIIADHSNKAVREPDFSKAVLKDADTLDEIGAMSIFMTSNWLDPQSPFFFYDLHQRLVEVEIPYCEKKLAILNTNGAREILLKKKSFLERFSAQLTDELETGAEIEQLLRDLFKGAS